MDIELPKEARALALASIERWFRENADEPIGNIQAAALLNFFIAEMVMLTMTCTKSTATPI